MEIFSQFDTYSLKARVFPALIAGFPTLLLLFVLVPWDHLALSQVIAASMGLVLLFAFADMARHRGKKLQERLGTGETPGQWLRGNPDVPEGSKDRYRNFVADQLRLPAPTLEDEKSDPERAADFYRSANAWLREETLVRRFGTISSSMGKRSVAFSSCSGSFSQLAKSPIRSKPKPSESLWSAPRS